MRYGHHLVAGLRAFLPFREGGGVPRSVIDGRLVLPQEATSVWASGARGFAYRHTTTTAREYIATNSSDLVPTSNCTIALGYKKTDTTLRASVAFGVNQTTNGRCHVHLPYSDGTTYWDFGGDTEGATRLSVASLTFGDDFWVFSTGSRGMEIWQNGVLRASNSANPTRTAYTDTFSLGNSGGVGAGDLAQYSYFALWRRQLSRQEIIALTAAPLQFLATVRTTFTPFSGAGGGIAGRQLLLGVG